MPTCPRAARAAALVLGLVFAGCITPSEKKGMKDDIFNVQTRLLNIEQQLVESNKEVKTTGDSAAKRIASTRADIDRLLADLQRIRGEIDALKVGVQTGQMPGSDPSDENSTAGKLNALSTRLEEVEASQAELLDAIQKAGGRKGNSKSIEKKGGSTADAAGEAKRTARNADELQKAFDQKQYQRVAEDAPAVLKSGQSADKERARYLWAESLFKLGKVRDAALRYNDFLDAKPSKKYQPLVKMRLGDCFRHLGDGDTAKVYYEELIKEFPNSDEAAKAKERLAEISGKGGATDRG